MKISKLVIFLGTILGLIGAVGLFLLYYYFGFIPAMIIIILLLIFIISKGFKKPVKIP